MEKPSAGQLLRLVEPVGNGAKVITTAELESGGFFGVAGPLVAKSIEDTFSSDLDILRAKLEASTRFGEWAVKASLDGPRARMFDEHPVCV